MLRMAHKAVACGMSVLTALKYPYYCDIMYIYLSGVRWKDGFISVENWVYKQILDKW